MSQILLRRLSAHSHGVRCLSSVVGGVRRRAGAEAAPPPQDNEASRAVRMSVWWDFENCNIPNGVNVYRVAPRVFAALRAAGIRVPLSITAFGDVLQLARSSQIGVRPCCLDLIGNDQDQLPAEENATCRPCRLPSSNPNSFFQLQWEGYGPRGGQWYIICLLPGISVAR